MSRKIYIILIYALFATAAYAQDFNVFFQRTTPIEVPQFLVKVELLSKVNPEAKYFESTMVLFNPPNSVSIQKVQFWKETRFLLVETVSGTMDSYDVQNNTLKDYEHRDAVLYAPNGIFMLVPKEYAANENADIYIRGISENSVYPLEYLDEFTVDTSTFINGFVQSLQMLESEFLKKSDYISASNYKESIAKFQSALSSLEKEKSVSVDGKNVYIELFNGAMISEIRIENEGNGNFSFLKNRIMSQGYPEFTGRIDDCLDPKTGYADEPYDFGFEVVRSGNGFKLDYGQKDWVEKLYDNKITGEFFRNKILSINDENPATLEDIYRIINKSDKIKIAVKDSGGKERSFTFRKLSGKERYMVRYTKFDTSDYFN